MYELIGAIAGVGALIYMAFFGQKTVQEWKKERKGPRQFDTIPDKPKRILHNLPNPEYGEFVGREAEFNEIIQQLRPYPYSQHAVITIDGVGGVGKSVLALEISHRFFRKDGIATDEKFEAIIWTSAKESVLTAEGIYPKKYALRTIQDIFNAIATTLEREDINQASGKERTNLLRKALTDQRTLLIIDNLETVDDKAVLEFLRDLPAPTKAIVTTRHRIDVAYPIRLKGMSKEEAFLLMEHECKKKNVELTDEQQAQLYERTGGIPLALVWGIAKMGLGFPFESLIQDLGKPTNDVARFCFELAVSKIKETNAYKLLLALGLFTTSASRSALGIITDLNEMIYDRDEGLVMLEKLSLVNKSGDRFSLLPLTKSFVLAELAEDQALEKTLGKKWMRYLKTLCGDPEHAYFWRWGSYEFIEDGPNILAAIDYAYEKGCADDMFVLAFGGIKYMEFAGLWFDQYELAKRAMSLARTCGNLRMAARFLGDMGWLSQQWGNYESAQKEFEEAHELFQEAHDQEGICRSLVWFSTIERKRGHFDKSEQLCVQALELANELKIEHLQIDVKDSLGKLMRDTNRLDEAWDYFKYIKIWGQSLVEGAPHREALTAGSWGHLAAVAIKRDQFKLAHDLCLKSLPFFEQQGSKGFVATLKYRLAQADLGLGRKEQAKKHAGEAHYWYKRLGMAPDVAEVEAFLAKLGE